MNIIGIAGPIGSGKSEVARFLCKQFGYIERAWADPLYAEVAAAFGVEVEWLMDRSIKEEPQRKLSFSCCNDVNFVHDMSIMNKEYEQKYGCFDLFSPNSPRKILQLWGTEYRRSKNSCFWLEKMEEFLKYGSGGTEPIRRLVIPGTRFANEAQWIRDHRGEVWYVTNRRCSVESDHASEKDITPDNADLVINNSGDIFSLYQQVLFFGERHLPLYMAEVL